MISNIGKKSPWPNALLGTLLQPEVQAEREREEDEMRTGRGQDEDDLSEKWGPNGFFFIFEDEDMARNLGYQVGTLTLTLR